MNFMTTRVATLALAMAVMAGSQAALTPYSQDFETLDIASPTALSGNGWLVFGNVFDSGDNYLYGYGPFAAPNGTGGFSSIATGEGGAEQGQQYLNVFSDYLNGDHGFGNKIEANVFQEQVIASGDLGSTYQFAFDYKASSQNGPSGQTRTMAFIKVLDPNSGYALVAFPVVETTTASTSNWARGVINITIGSGWTGHILQFGFLSNATLYQPSGVYYDNITFSSAQKTISGTINLASYVGNPSSRAITFELVDGSNTTVQTQTLNLDGSNGYSFPTSVANGNYDVYVKGTTWLRKKIASVAVGSGGATVSTTLDYNGDLDNNNVIDSDDFDILVANFGGSGAGDVDGSGNTDSDDFDILVANFGLGGD